MRKRYVSCKRACRRRKLRKAGTPTSVRLSSCERNISFTNSQANENQRKDNDPSRLWAKRRRVREVSQRGALVSFYSLQSRVVHFADANCFAAAFGHRNSVCAGLRPR